MRIVQLTPGTGSFFCGTCLRDNAMVAELRRRGHDALLVPMYLPLTLDEPAANTGAPLFYGGVNVYLQQKLSLFRKTPRWLDQLLDAPSLLRFAGKKAGMTSARELGVITLSMLRGEDGSQEKELDRLVDWLAKELRPDVVVLSNALLMGLARRIKRETGAAVVCTLQGEDSFLDSLPEPERSQSWRTLSERAADVDAFLGVSQYYGDLMQRRAELPPERVHLVHGGILLDGYAPAAAPPDPPVLGFLARMCYNKGLETLVEAFILLKQRNRIPGLKLHAAGSETDADRVFVAGLKQRLAAKGLAGETEFSPNLDRDEKIRFLQSLSVLSVPATYGEAFGLYVIEAMAAGVPVVQPNHAAFPELLEATGGGLLCEPNDPQSLAVKVEELLLDPVRARRMGEHGRRVVLEQFSVAKMTDDALAVFERVAGRVPVAGASR